MKVKFIVLLTSSIIITLTSYAGEGFLFKNLKLKRVGVNLGMEQDLIMGNRMSHSYFNSLVDHPNLNSNVERFVDANFVKHSGVCENPHFRINLAYELPKANREFNLTLVGVFDRIDGVNYQRISVNGDYDYLSYDMYSNELALEASYVFKREVSLIRNIFGLNFYGLAGTNFGYQFDNEVTMSGVDELREREFGTRIAQPSTASLNEYTFEENEYFTNYYSASSAFNLRAFSGVGVGLLFFNRLELGLNGRYGYGFRYHLSNDFTPTNLRSLDITAKWVLK